MAWLRRQRLFAYLGLAFAAGALPWLHTVAFGFVFDDRWTLVDNPWLNEPWRRLWTLLLHGDAPRLGVPDATRPTMVLSMWLDHLHGSAALSHLSSVVLHGALTAAAFALAFALLRGRLPALAVAVLFALGTSQLEATAVINYREDLLAALGLLVALAVLLWPGRRSPLADAGAGLALLLALGAKESAVAIVLLVPLLALAQRAPLRWLARQERLLLTFVAVLVLWGSWRWSLTLGAGDGLPRAAEHGAQELGLRLSRYLVWTARAAALPTTPVPIHDTAPAPGWGSPVLLTLGLAALLAVVVRGRRRPGARVLGVGVGWVLLTALPSSPLAGPANEQADRYLLLPGFGAALAWVALGSLVLAPRWRVRVFGVASAALLSFSVASSLTWRDELTLFEAATLRAPEAPQAWAGLAYVLRHRGELPRARQAADTACRLAPHSAPIRLTRAYVLIEASEDDKARADLDWVRARGGDEVPGLRRAVECLARPPSGRRDCLRAQVSAP